MGSSSHHLKRLRAGTVLFQQIIDIRGSFGSPRLFRQIRHPGSRLLFLALKAQNPILRLILQLFFPWVLIDRAPSPAASGAILSIPVSLPWQNPSIPN